VEASTEDLGDEQRANSIVGQIAEFICASGVVQGRALKGIYITIRP
jgi:hypothetical protein